MIFVDWMCEAQDALGGTLAAFRPIPNENGPWDKIRNVKHGRFSYKVVDG